MNGDVLITGATGLIGGEIAWRLMRAGRRVWCIVRSKSFQEAAARFEARFALSGQTCDWSKLVALPGDITHDLLGLDDNGLSHLRRDCPHVIHCAAETSFATHNRCAQVNLTGTRNVLRLCEALGQQVRLFHMSSAVVCSKRSGGSAERRHLESAEEHQRRSADPPLRYPDSHCLTRVIHEDDAPAGFSNDYVLSKRNCEQLVLQSPVDAIILRPSIVLSHGVQSAKFARSILWVLPVMRRLGVLPLTGQEPIDAVSVQFVAECVVRMLDRPLRHRIYHLSAGPEVSITLAELFQALSRQGHDYSGIRFRPGLDQARFSGARIAEKQSAAKPPPEAELTTDCTDATDKRNPCHPCNPWLGMRLKGPLDYYLPFLASGAVYTRDRLDEALGGDLPACPILSEYCADLLNLFSEREAWQEALTP